MGKTAPKQEEKKVEQQDTTMRIPLDLKAEIEKMRKPQESAADVVRRLLINRAVKEASEDGTVLLKLTEKNYTTLVAFQPTVALSEMLTTARVT